MSIDWDGLVLGPIMDIFGDGQADDPSTWPLYMPVGGAAFRLAGAVFDRETLIVTTGDEGTENISRMPVIGVRDALVIAGCGRVSQQGDKITIPSVGFTFIVREPHPDGHGHSKLLLQRMP